MKVPFVDLTREIAPFKDEVLGGIADVVADSSYILGPRVRLFEEEFASFCGVGHAVGVASGSDALMLALIACGVRAGDEVAVPANTFIATFDAVSHCGARPVPVDVDPDSYNIDPARLEDAITEKTSALLPVHLYGQAADMDAVLDVAQRRGLVVVEDAAQGHGAYYKGKRLGSLGVCGCFSFYPSKNLGAMGDGGMAVTDDESIAERLRLLRNYGQSEKNVHLVVGFNSRLDEVQASVLRAKLKRLDGNNSLRRAAADRYAAGLAGVEGVVLPKRAWGDEAHVYHLFVIRCAEREGLIAHLNESGVSTGIHYPVPPHLQPAYQHLGYGEGSFPVTERLSDEVLSLPMFPGISDEEVDYVCDRIAEFCSRGS